MTGIACTIANLCERNKHDILVTLGVDFGRYGKCESGFSDPTRTGQGHQRHINPVEQSANDLDLLLLADQWGE